MREGLVGGDEVERFFSGIAARPEQGAAGAGDVERNDAVFLRGFGRRLLAARTRLGMPRWQLAARSGVSERHIRNAEGGIGNVSLLVLRALAGSLAVDPLDLLEARPDSRLHRLADRLDAGQREAAFEVLQRHFSTQGDPRRRRIALVGRGGMGAAEVGGRLAAMLGVRFVAFDVAMGAAVSVEAMRRLSPAAVVRVQRKVLAQVVAGEEGVVVVFGAEVAAAQMVDSVMRVCRTVWLRSAVERGLLGAALFARADGVVDMPGQNGPGQSGLGQDGLGQDGEAALAAVLAVLGEA